MSLFAQGGATDQREDDEGGLDDGDVPGTKGAPELLQDGVPELWPDEGGHGAPGRGIRAVRGRPLSLPAL